MEPQSDILQLKKIYEAENQADRIIRHAEAEAKHLVEKAREEAKKTVETKQRRLVDRNTRMLAEEIGQIEREGRAVLEGARDQANRFTQRVQPRVDSIVDRLLEILFPQ